MYDNRICEICVEVLPLERELAAYQNAEMPEANHAELVKHMREESQAGGELDCPLCGQAADYLDALAKRCARLEVALSKKPCSALEGDEVGNPCSYYRDLTVELEAAWKDSDEAIVVLRDLLGFCQRRLHTGHIPPQGQRAIDFLNSLTDKEHPIDALAAGKEKRDEQKI